MDYILFTDADLSTPLEELEKFKEYFENYDIVIGSRKMLGSNIVIEQPFYRRKHDKLVVRLLHPMSKYRENDDVIQIR